MESRLKPRAILHALQILQETVNRFEDRQIRLEHKLDRLLAQEEPLPDLFPERVTRQDLVDLTNDHCCPFRLEEDLT